MRDIINHVSSPSLVHRFFNKRSAIAILHGPALWASTVEINSVTISAFCFWVKKELFKLYCAPFFVSRYFK